MYSVMCVENAVNRGRADYCIKIKFKYFKFRKNIRMSET